MRSLGHAERQALRLRVPWHYRAGGWLLLVIVPHTLWPDPARTLGWAALLLTLDAVLLVQRWRWKRRAAAHLAAIVGPKPK